jgi:putative transposase
MDDNLERYCLTIQRSNKRSTLHNSFLSKEILSKEQKKDYHFGKIYRLSEFPENCKDYELLDNYVIDKKILYKKVKVNNQNKIVVCLPLRFRLEVLYSYHDDALTGGHLGIAKTIDKIMNRYYWPSMRKDIIEYVQSCTECQAKKKLLLPPAGMMIPITKKRPFDTIGIDFLGRFKLSKSGNTYIIAATDYFTKWVVCKAIAAATKEIAADFLIQDIICKYGAFSQLISERGVQFRAQLSQAIYERLAIRHLTTTSYHPQTNGQPMP